MEHILAGDAILIQRRLAKKISHCHCVDFNVILDFYYKPPHNLSNIGINYFLRHASKKANSTALLPFASEVVALQL